MLDADHDTDTLSLVQVGNRTTSGNFTYGLTRKCLDQVGQTYRKNKAAERKGALYRHFRHVTSYPIEHISEVLPALRDCLARFEADPTRNASLTLLYSPADFVPEGEFCERARKSFDAKRTQHLHTLDFDDMVAPDWLRGRAIEAHAEWLALEVLPEPWASTSFVAMFTGSHGTVHDKTDLYVPRLRLFFYTEPPLTPAQFKRHVVQLEHDMSAKGVRHVGKLLDTTIYSPERMIFVLPGQVVNGEGAAHTGERLAYYDGDTDLLKLIKQPEIYTETDQADDRSALAAGADDRLQERSLNLSTGEAGEYAGLNIDATLNRMVLDGKTNAGMLRIRWLIAREHYETDQREQRREAFDAVLPQIIEAFRQISPDPDELDRRLESEIGFEPSTGTLHCRLAYRDIEIAAAKVREQRGRFALVPVGRCESISSYAADAATDVTTLSQAASSERVRAELESDMFRTFNDVAKLAGDDRLCAVFQHAAGVGKSQAALTAAVAKALGAEQLYIIMAAPTRALAEQLHKRAKLAAYHWHRKRGLSKRDAALTVREAPIALKTSRKQHCLFERPGASDREMFGEAARQAERFGLNPIEMVCKACGHCDWPEVAGSWHQPKKGIGQLSIVTHADLVTTFKRNRKRQPHCIVIDEAFFGAIEAKTTASLTDLKNTKFLRARSMYSEADAAELLGRINANRKLLVKALSLAHGQVLRQHVGPLHSKLADFIDDEAEYRKRKTRLIRTSIKQGTPRHIALKQHGPDVAKSDAIRDICQVIWRSLSVAGRSEIWELYTHDDGAQVTARWLDNLPGKPSYVLLDGSLRDASEVDFVFGRNRPDMRFYSGELPTPHVNLYQFAGKFYGKSGFAGSAKHGNSNAANLANFVRLQSMLHRSVLLIAQNDVLANVADQLPNNVSTLNFGALRGKNEHVATPCLIMVGRPTVSPRELESIARIRHHNNAAAVEIAEHSASGRWLEGRHIVNTTTGPVEIGCERHTDPRAEVVRRMMADDDVQQGLARLRLADRTAETAPTVYYWGTADLGVQIQGLYNTEPTISVADMAQTIGLYFEQPRLMHQFYTGKYVKTYDLDGLTREKYSLGYQAAVSGRISNSDTPIGKTTLREGAYTTYRFKLVPRPGEQRQRWRTVIDVSGKSPDTVHALISRYIGPVGSFEYE